MPAQASPDLNAFIAALQDKSFFARAGRGFALLTPGDWQGLQRWAESLGFTFTLQDLLAYCSDHPSVLGQLSNSPQLSGWGLESLRQAAQA
jgi:hypothetical protein